MGLRDPGISVHTAETETATTPYLQPSVDTPCRAHILLPCVHTLRSCILVASTGVRVSTAFLNAMNSIRCMAFRFPIRGSKRAISLYQPASSTPSSLSCLAPFWSLPCLGSIHRPLCSAIATAAAPLSGTAQPAADRSGLVLLLLSLDDLLVHTPHGRPPGEWHGRSTRLRPTARAWIR